MKNCEKHFLFNLNVTEVRDSDFKNAFPGIFNLTVGIIFSSRKQCIFIKKMADLVAKMQFLFWLLLKKWVEV